MVIEKKEIIKLESYNLLDYKLELMPIENFHQYYNENKESINTFPKKQFLKACRIPANYFLEQPSETRETLLENHKITIEETNSLSGRFLVLLKKDNKLINSCRIEYDNFQDIFERINLPKEKYKELTLVRTFIKEGFINIFIPVNSLKQGEYNAGVFVDIPIMCNKKPKIYKGFYYIPTNNENNYKCLYISSFEVNYLKYQMLELCIDEMLEEVVSTSDKEIISFLQGTLLSKELEEILIRLNELKNIPKSYIKGIERYVDKNNIQLPNVFSLVDILLAYDESIRGYRRVTKLRTILEPLLKILEIK